MRRALHDEAARPRFIRTVPRFGYAFDGVAPAADRVASVNCRLLWAGGSALLVAGEHLLGRDPALHVVIDEPSVSRRHARIEVVASDVTYEDLGSKNGSYRSGDRLEGAVRLRDGDVVRVGLVEVQVRIHPAIGATRTAVQ
jgi:hypothetical protein